MIVCADSRVDPSIVLQADPGDPFVIRNVANLAPPFEEDGLYHGTSAALEFAVKHLKVGHIIVLGHAHCGGIRSLFNDPTEAVEQARRASGAAHRLQETVDLATQGAGFLGQVPGIVGDPGRNPARPLRRFVDLGDLTRHAADGSRSLAH